MAIQNSDDRDEGERSWSLWDAIANEGSQGMQ